MPTLKIIGAGLAGSEAAYQASKNPEIEVLLYEMRPKKLSKAHKTGKMAELVCSNSFRGAQLSNAVGLLKEELKILDSLIMEAALVTEVPAGGALAVDRELFSAYVDQKIRSISNIKVIEEEVLEIPEASADAPVVVATGPLTSEALSLKIEELTGASNLAFFDAISPVFLAESINMDVVFKQSRHDKGGDDYLNIPLTKDQYEKFISDVSEAETYGGKEEVESDCTENLRPFEGCMPIEEMISRGPETLRFGPLKPVGLVDPRDGKEPHAVIQLRMDDKKGFRWSMVGMQTKMKRGEQERVFRSLPGLENVEFVRFGTLHRNSFINSPNCLNSSLEFREKPGLFFAGQMTGVEGYVESTASGLLAGINSRRLLEEKSLLELPLNTASGALVSYVSEPGRQDFQPMNISFGLMPSYLSSPKKILVTSSDPDGKTYKKRLSKKERREIASAAAIDELKKFSKDKGLLPECQFSNDQNSNE